jgi:hypothetical protein
MANELFKASIIVCIEKAHAKKPHALGPLLGVLLLHAVLSSAFAARVVGVQETILVRWLTGGRDVPAQYAESVGTLVGLLAWLYGRQSKLPHTTVGVRESTLLEYMKNYGLFTQPLQL